MGLLLLHLFLSQSLGDRVRMAEVMESAVKTQNFVAGQREQEMARQRRIEFEKRFDALAAAISDFAKEYNKGGGQVWPGQKADELRKAMEAVQQADTRLKGHN